MTSDQWTTVSRLFAEALALPPARRDALLAGADGVVRAEVISLLAAHDAAGDRFEQPLSFDDLGGAPSVASDLAPGDVVGPYRIEEEIGRGGMGTVYRAVRADGLFARAAALKVVRRGMDSEAVLRRFHRERAVLAGLQHPHIARLYDGGTAPDGRPFFAMELVDGQPLTAYADAHRLGLDARLRLFLQVCAAVAYAHRALVLHRDLKPSNILVTADGQVKLVDFGLARLLTDEADAGPALTAEGPRPLTPEYAAPEQFDGRPPTTAADVYSLGVVLYELLAGHRPYRLSGGGWAALAEAVRTQAPDRPSVAALRAADRRSLGAETVLVTAEAAALRRDTAPDRLARALRGDLDAVCLKALRKEPESRYATAEALSDDLRRHLARLPVDARRGGARYRAGKFVRRHRVAVAATALALTSIIGGAGVALREARVASTARVRAEVDVARAGAAARFFESLFSQGDAPLEERTAREILAAGERRIDELDGDPEVQAHVLGVLGGIYRSMGNLDRAEQALRRALAVHERRRAPDDLVLADARFDLGYVLAQANRLAEADSLYRLAVAVREAQLAPSDGPVVFGRAARASVLVQLRRFAEAERLYRAALAGASRMATASERDLHTTHTLQGLARLLAHQGRAREATALAARALAIQLRRSGPDSSEGGYAWLGYGGFLRAAGDTARAEAAVRRGRAILMRRLPPTHVMRNDADI
ncbi:MAG TPA: serine/threonine-protein kinase, partial [Rubricoccaceae bacterium]|nr:serine/threonine-protein kinase [Rubricoccaceae bacterium]